MDKSVYFVWTPESKLSAGVGGSETTLFGFAKELDRRGFKTTLVTIGLGEDDGRDSYPEATYLALKSVEECRKLKGRVIYINQPALKPLDKKTKVASYLSCPVNPFAPPKALKRQLGYAPIMLYSNFSRGQWAKEIGCDPTELHILYPFADEAFSNVEREPYTGNPRLLYAGRLRPQKGIYVLLEALHLKPLLTSGWKITTVKADMGFEDSQPLVRMVTARKGNMRLIGARRTPKAMAKLLAEHDVLIMPSRNDYWHESFGMLSIEAQMAGCRVVASKGGGLPETDCGIGALELIEPHDPLKLSEAVYKVGLMPRITPAQRRKASKCFSLAESVDNLLDIVG